MAPHPRGAVTRRGHVGAGRLRRPRPILGPPPPVGGVAGCRSRRGCHDARLSADGPPLAGPPLAGPPLAGALAGALGQGALAGALLVTDRWSVTSCVPCEGCALLRHGVAAPPPAPGGRRAPSWSPPLEPERPRRGGRRAAERGPRGGAPRPPSGGEERKARRPPPFGEAFQFPSQAFPTLFPRRQVGGR